MKKLTLFAIAALAMAFVSCGNQNGNKTEKEPEQNTKDETVNPSTDQVTYITYTNDKYGFSVEVPQGMIKKGELMGDEGTVYVVDEESGAFNSIGISGSKQIFDEEYTPEKVRKDFEYWIEGKDVASMDCGDDYFTYTLKGEMLTEIYRHVYQGTKVAMVSIYYDEDHEEQLGGEVAEHVLNSIQFN